MQVSSSVLILSALLVFSSAYGQGKDWYQSIGSTCSGYTPLNDGLQTYFSKPLPLKPVDAAHGFAVQLTPDQVADIKSKTPYLYEQIDIDPAKAKSLKSIVDSASQQKVPLLFKLIMNVYQGYVIPNAFAGATSGALFDYVYEKQEAFATQMDKVAQLVADGGSLQKRLYAASNGLGDFLVSETAYSIALGKEGRTAVLFACVLPISYQVSQFETQGPYNNKILKPKGGGVWQRWDIEDSKWDASTLRYAYQDKDNYFFEEDEIEYDKVVGITTHKISLKGGAWQRKKSSAPDYVTS
ncbi:hypothetical protein HUS91_32170, partial [Pseudomonas chlororaphis]